MSEFADLDGSPIAPLVGPFTERPFLEVWRRHRRGGDIRIIRSLEAALPLVFDRDSVRIAGEAHLTDYHSPLGTDPAGLGARLLGAAPHMLLDSLPSEAADPLLESLERAGGKVTRTEDEPCMVLDLDGREEWEAALTAKDRHEIRRKRRRFAGRYGSADIENEPAALGAFVDMHRSSDGVKAGFMTEAMAAFFEDLLTLEGARLHVLRGGDRGILAAVVGFEDEDAYYVYNSAFDPEAGDVSPGIVLIDRLIGRAASTGRRRFDFLKGAESYKRRMGATRRPLYRLEVTS